jgi:hypothetical protein
MKLLWMGSSNDAYGEMPEGVRAYRVAQAMLAEAVGEPVELTLKRAWPTAEFPGIVEGWMRRYEPEAVFLTVSNYSFAYESVPLKIQRRFGRPGKSVAQASLKAAKVPWIAGNPVFRGGRRLAQLTIGGATAFEPEQVIESASEAIRVIVRHENPVVVVKGPTNRVNYYPSKRAAERAERRRQQVHQALRGICRDLHVHYLGFDRPAYTGGRVATLADHVHYAVETQRVAGLEDGTALVAAWRAARGEGALARR